MALCLKRVDITLKFLASSSSLKLVNIALVFFVFGTVFPAISLSDYVNISAERFVFKGVGVVFLTLSVVLMMVLNRCRLRPFDLTLLVMIIALPFVFALSSSIYDISESLIQWFRLIAVLLIVIFLSALNEHELSRALKIYCYVAFALGLISFYQYLVGYPAYEKLPVINIRSNKSIIFEQNVYGLFMYMSFLIYGLISTDRNKWEKRGVIFVYLFGIFISFYRTVYVFTFLQVFVKHVIITLLVVVVVMGFVYFSDIRDTLADVLKLEQISTLTGRDTLWMIALDSFYSAPLIGLGENSIPDVSNAILNRDPPFTTYHNVIMDVLAISGVIGFVIYSFLFLYIFVRIERDHRLIYLMLMAPALLNTYIAFMPNPLGGMLGVFVFYSINVRRNRQIQRRKFNAH